ncbi:hypothetical protein AB4037_20575 [Labrys sp. KB_33_2]|uniref:hypothetical protein n=1 Tax=Labrys sp. KB_33_2 TaxID=3237479 RepID=UPI003F8F25C6
MSRQSLLRTGLIAALIFGSVVGSITTSFAASTGPGAGGNGGNGGGRGASAGPSGGGGGGGGISPEARLIIANPPPCRTHVCNPPPRPPVVRIQTKFVDQTRCTNVWRQVVLDDGSVIEDRTMPMRKHCRVIRNFD